MREFSITKRTHCRVFGLESKVERVPVIFDSFVAILGVNELYIFWAARWVDANTLSEFGSGEREKDQIKREKEILAEALSNPSSDGG